MSPTIEKAAIVTFDDKVPFSDLKLDDIIVFNTHNGILIGRVINVTAYGLVAQGDNNPSASLGHITEEYCLGKSCAHSEPMIFFY